MTPKRLKVQAAVDDEGGFEEVSGDEGGEADGWAEDAEGDVEEDKEDTKGEADSPEGEEVDEDVKVDEAVLINTFQGVAVVRGRFWG